MQIEKMAILCSKCGTSNDDESIYCGACGAPLRSGSASLLPPELAPKQMTSVPPVQRPQIPKGTRNKVIAADAVILIIVVIAVALFSYRGVAPTTVQSQSLNIVNGSLNLDKGGYVYYMFTVPGGATDSQVKGNFTVATGGGDGIQVYIMNNENLFIWANSPASAHVSTYYQSGKVTLGSINARLSPGTYYLIFDNTFSNSSKVVQTNVSLVYNP